MKQAPAIDALDHVFSEPLGTNWLTRLKWLSQKAVVNID
jgi:hypothetical protein